MNREFIPHEEALALKELGYKGDIIGMYDEDKYLFTLHDQDDIEDEWLPAPLYQQAFRWFRENFGLDSYIKKEDKLSYFSFVFTGVVFEQCGIGTYEEAELGCLRKLIEIVKQKKIK